MCQNIREERLKNKTILTIFRESRLDWNRMDWINVSRFGMRCFVRAKRNGSPATLWKLHIFGDVFLHS